MGRFTELFARREAPPTVERRQSSGAPFTDAVAQALLAQAQGTATATADATAALEAAAGAVARAFAAAEIENAGASAAALTPDCLALIGRNLIRRGESLHVIDVKRGTVQLLPVGSWDVRGGWERRTWVYRADLFGPSGNITRLLPEAAIVHCRYAVDPARPWHGVSPLDWARNTGRLAGALEAALANEAGGPHGFVIPVPDAGDVDDADADDATAGGLTTDLVALKGQTALVETTSAGYGQGQSEAPKQDWKPQRIGANPPDGLRSLRSDAARAVLAACGAPVELFEKADGTGQREAWRRFLYGTVAPLARTIQAELRDKLDAPDLTLSFEDLRASDLEGRARAFRGMVTGGMDVADAAALAGLMADGD